jgi:hypothetical protein
MNKVCLDPTLGSQLRGFSSPVEICDEFGQSLGHFLPTPIYRQLLVAWSQAEVSDEELRLRASEPGGCSLAEIWQRLGKT